MQAETGGEGRVGERAVAVVVVEGGGVVGEIGFEDVEIAVAIVVGHGRAHAGLGAPVLVEGGAGHHGHVGKGAIVVVVVENAGRAVASDINVRPAIVVVVQSGDAER